MKHLFLYLFTVLAIFKAEPVYSQDVSRFSSDKNKFSVGFELSGSFPAGSFTNVTIKLPCNSSVNVASAFELTLGYKINSKFGGVIVLSEGFFPMDPSSSGVSQLLNDHPGVYQSAAVFKSGQLISQAIMVGGYYNYPLSKNGKIYSKTRLMAGLIACSIPEIEVVGQRAQGPVDINGNSIDTTESWDSPKIYAYAPSIRVDEGVYYVLNKSLEFFINLHFQVSSLTYSNVTVNSNLLVTSTNSSTGNSTTLANDNHLSVVNPTIIYQAISLGLGCEFRF